LLEHVQGFEATRAGKGILHVHLPARSTDDERRQLREAGYDQDVGAVAKVVEKRWRNLRVDQRFATGVGAPAEITP